MGLQISLRRSLPFQEKIKVNCDFQKNEQQLKDRDGPCAIETVICNCSINFTTATVWDVRVVCIGLLQSIVEIPNVQIC